MFSIEKCITHALKKYNPNSYLTKYNFATRIKLQCAKLKKQIKQKSHPLNQIEKAKKNEAAYAEYDRGHVT